jgi:phenylalanyl-tRNA synthetase beta chain
MYGYHNLPSTIMPTTIPDTPTDENFDLEYTIKTLLSGWGLNEVYTYSMVSKEKALLSGKKLDDHLEIKNPLTDDMVYLRTSLIPSLLEIANENQNKEVFVYEMQNVFHKATNPQNLPKEDLRLTILTNRSYAHLKGVLDALTQKLFIIGKVAPTKKEARDGFDAEWGTVLGDGEVLGTIGQTIKQGVYALDLSMNALQKVAHTHPTYIPIASTPPIVEDLTFAIKTKTHISPIMDAMQEVSPLIESVVLKDTYENTKLQTTNFTFTLTYRDKNKQLTDGELAPIRKAIVKKLAENNVATLIGSL